MDLHSSIEIHFGSKAFNLVALVFMLYMLAFMFQKTLPPTPWNTGHWGVNVSLQGISASFTSVTDIFSVTSDLWLHFGTYGSITCFTIIWVSCTTNCATGWAKCTIKKFTKPLCWNQMRIQQFQQAKKGRRRGSSVMWFNSYLLFPLLFSFLSTLSNPLWGYSLQL